MSDTAVSPGGHVTCLGTLLLPVAPPSTVRPADLQPHTHTTTVHSLGQLTSTDLVSAKGGNKSQLIDIDSQPHQTMFQYTDSTL